MTRMADQRLIGDQPISLALGWWYSARDKTRAAMIGDKLVSGLVVEDSGRFMPTLDWYDKQGVIVRTGQVPYRLLEHARELSHGAPDSPNMLIQGDNLEALKALLPFYAGQVKCIFIDPPYNTKSAFAHYDDNLEHSQWLSMMWPRLELLRELLAENGSIWVSIDDNEGHYLKVIMDEVFGRGNFVANAVWQKKYTVSNDAKWFSNNHDHILVHAKNKNVWLPNRLPRSDEMNARYANPDKHQKGPWKATPLHAKSGSEKNKNFTFTFKNGYVWSPPPGTFPRFSKETLRRYDEEGEIWSGRDGTAQPSRKTFLSELTNKCTPPLTVWLNEDVSHNHEAKSEAKTFNTDDVFSTPKPERLLQRILHIATNPGDFVLDSFLGSGTTAAVAHKMGRRWIGIEMGGHAVTHCAPRLKKVIDGEDKGGITEVVGWQGGGGFCFYRLGQPVFDEEGHICRDITFPVLAAHIWFSETGTPWNGTGENPLLGLHDGQAFALLYNGILGDRRGNGGNVLTRATLALIREESARLDPACTGLLTVYGERSALLEITLAREGITFKQTPYDVKARR